MNTFSYRRVLLTACLMLAPLVPPVILNSGQNYWDHRDEKPEVDQKEPEFFLKTPFAVIGPDEPVLYDDLSVEEHVEYIGRLHGVEDWPARADDLPEGRKHESRVAERREHRVRPADVRQRLQGPAGRVGHRDAPLGCGGPVEIVHAETLENAIRRASARRRSRRRRSASPAGSGARRRACRP